MGACLRPDTIISNVETEADRGGLHYFIKVSVEVTGVNPWVMPQEDTPCLFEDIKEHPPSPNSFEVRSCPHCGNSCEMRAYYTASLS